MEIRGVAEKILKFLNKYKFVVLVFLIGLTLLLIPDGKKEVYNDVQQTPYATDSKIDKSFEQKLKEILTQIHGAGRVEVMLTISEGEEIIYQTNDSLSGSGEASNKDTDTVTITDSNKNQIGLVRKTNPPVYQGAIIVCQGADNPIVKFAITEAVSKITGIGANCISVLKMK